ncbi:MAG: glutamate mutase L [Lachnospiraceae bacterium]|nr:glutamate mutase L [Lachnospiraceae bacterium]
MLANILVYDIGSTYTKAAAFHLEDEVLTFCGRSQALTTLEDINQGAEKAKKAMEESGIEFAENTKKYSSCSAAGGLRMVALGYMPRVTAKAAKEVAMTAGARVMEVISSDESPEYREEVLREICPDIILLAGGTDSGDETSVHENVEIICKVKGKATVILACNKFAQRYAAGRLREEGIPYIRVQNIMPTIHELNIGPARAAIHEQFIRQITKAQGLKEFRENLADQTVIPTPGAVLLASELLARGTYEQDGIDGLIIVDIGGATTDIHSVLPRLEGLELEERGLVISNQKQVSYRTVEGNLGMRVSATGIPEAIGPKAVLRVFDNPAVSMEPDELLEYTEFLEENTNHIAKDEKEKTIDRALAYCAIDLALKRHAGTFMKENDPEMGLMAGTPVGRDLRMVETVLCVGGAFVYMDHEKRQEMMERCFDHPDLSLLPIKRPKILFDDDYLMFAMGVLGKHYPDAVLSFMKQEFNLLDNEQKNV